MRWQAIFQIISNGETTNEEQKTRKGIEEKFNGFRFRSFIFSKEILFVIKILGNETEQGLV